MAGTMGSYSGRHAEYYDIFYSDKNYPAEALFVHECLQRFGDGNIHSLLELACGSGNHALQLEAHGYQIIATDYSESLLAVAQGKAQKKGSKVDFRLADMRSLELEERRFDAALCLFDSIGYVQTNDALMRVLTGVQAHLRPGGLFIFEFWHAAAMVKGYDPVRVGRWPMDGGDLLRISTTRLEILRQLAEVTYDIYELGKNGRYQHLKEIQVNRYFLVQEMAAFLVQAGLEPLAWLDGYSWKENINEDTWHVLAIARRRLD
jgi:SAM-dependent methyltransferase